MARRWRRYSEADKALMWDRWQRGESLQAIADLFGRHHSAIQGILTRSGGIRPPKRQRSRLALSLTEREEISGGVMAGHSIRSIADALGRAPSTVSRELRRNGGLKAYRANMADHAARDRARRAKHCKLAANPALARIVAVKLQLQWSPRQISDTVSIRERPAEWKTEQYQAIGRVICYSAATTARWRRWSNGTRAISSSRRSTAKTQRRSSTHSSSRRRSFLANSPSH